MDAITSETCEFADVDSGDRSLLRASLREPLSCVCAAPHSSVDAFDRDLSAVIVPDTVIASFPLEWYEVRVCPCGRGGAGVLNEHFWYLKSCSLFEQLAPEDVALLETRARSRTFERKQSIYVPQEQSDSLLVVAAGRVKLYHITPDGKESLLAFIERGEVFGELAVLDESSRDEFAEAVLPTQIVLIPGSVVRDLMAQRPALAMSITKLIGLRRKRLEQRMKSLLFRSTRDRLVHVLLDLATQYGRNSQRGLNLDLKLSHQDLANMIGSTRESVTLLLGQLQYERLLFIEKRMITLVELDKLAAGIDMPLPEALRTSSGATRAAKSAHSSRR